MAANRFATMLHRNTNKITLSLIYAVLEWILIVLLLLNSLFSYSILKFAEFFGLKPPCLWCTRIDHVFDSTSKGGKQNLHRDHLCEAHAREIGRLGFCLSHKKLADSQNLCGDCFSSLSWAEVEGFLKNAASFSEVKHDVHGEVGLDYCSCCGVSLDCNKYASFVVVKTSSWDVLECAQKVNLVTKAGENDDKISVEDLEVKQEGQMLCGEFDGNLEVTEKSCDSEAVDELKGEEDDDKKDVGLGAEGEKETLMVETSDLVMKDKSVQVCVEQDASVETSTRHLEFCLDYSGHTLVPIESMDSAADNESKEDAEVEDDGKNKEQEVSPDPKLGIASKEDKFIDVDINEEPQCFMEIEEDENSLVFHPKTSHLIPEEFEAFETFPLARWPSEEARCLQELAEASMERHFDAHSDNEEVARESNGNEADVSIGTEIPDIDTTDEVQIQDSVHSHECMQDPSMEEEKVSDTPTSVESLNQLHEKLLMLEKRDSEESLDGSELDSSDGVITIEQLKSALRAEQKALQVVYSELEEERSASAVAANQTMAMINRLQEEKAAMQMEALQYQRMMEEQSEYDQEALQLLNELMVKREKEKQEVEKELEVYRKKLLEYETKEKMRVLRRSSNESSRSGVSSASCSEDSDGVSIDLNREAKEEEGFCGGTPVDAVFDLEESLAEFEEERLAILEQLKVLEEKLLTLDGDDIQNGPHFENVTEIEEEDVNKHSNGFTKENTVNGNHHRCHRLAGHKGKSLLPLFDAMSDENGGVETNGNGNKFDHIGAGDSCEMEDKKLAVEEEVDHLYERLQALEADRELLKRCIGSLKKGDKGMELLREILQHLRDLRSVELRVRSLSDSAFIDW